MQRHLVVSSPGEAEKQLNFSELRYRRLFETAQDGVLILDAVTDKIVDVNPFLKELLGYSEKELLGMQLWQIGIFKDIVDSKKAFLELRNKGYVHYKDLLLQTRSGRTISVEFVSNIYMVNDEKVIQCNIRDITDRKSVEKLAENRAQKLEHLSKFQEQTNQAMLNVMEDLEVIKAQIEVEKVKYGAILASIGEGLIAVDGNRKIMIMNKAAENMLGWKMSEVVGCEITNLPLEDEAGNTIPLIKRPTHIVLTTGKTITNTYYFVKKDKTRFPISVTVTPIKLNGKIIGALDIFRDITQEKEIDDAKSEFVSLASHQLRTPLGISKWYMEAIKEAGYFNNTPQIAKDYLNEIYKNNERLLALVRGLLSISRIDQGNIKNAPEVVDIIQTIKDVLRRMNVLALKNNIIIKFETKKEKIPALFIDLPRLQEVLENLMTNAITYSNPLGIVEITVGLKNDMVIVTVKDTGVGISDVDKKKLFTKFFRSEKAVAKNTEGSGLGLYVVKSYVEGWGGNISVESIEGKGSSFSITLPLKMKVKKRKKVIYK